MSCKSLLSTNRLYNLHYLLFRHSYAYMLISFGTTGRSFLHKNGNNLIVDMPILSAFQNLAILLLLFFLFRLFRTQSLFHKAKKKIRKLLGIEPLWVLLRLTDKEIRLFATQPTAVLEDFARKEKLKSVRWRQIYQSYFT